MNNLIDISQTNEQLLYEDLKWYQKREFVLIFLIFLFPPLGLFWIFKGVYKKGKDGLAIRVGAIGKLYSTSYVIFFVSLFMHKQFLELAIMFLLITPVIHLYLQSIKTNRKSGTTSNSKNEVAKTEFSMKGISSSFNKALNWHTERKLKIELAERIRREKLNNILLCLVNNEALPITKWYNEQDEYKATELIPISVLYEKYIEVYDDILEELQSEGNVHAITKDLEFLNEGKLKAFFSHLAKIQEQNSEETESDTSWVDNNRGKVATGVAAASLFAGYKMARKKK